MKALASSRRGLRGKASALFDAAARRIALLRRKAPEGVKGPALRRQLAEADVLIEPFRRRLRRDMEIARASESRLVMLLPGFATHPVRMRYMAEQLRRAGHTVENWGLGWNLGPTEQNFEFLADRACQLHRRDGRKVVLVGWSLGGIFAREIAKLHPEAVAKVITMGSPFSGDPHANNAWRLYHLITGHPVDDPPVRCDVPEKPPVETVALWSPRDGIVSPRSSCGRKGERDRAVALRCTHLGFAYSPESIKAVLRELQET